MALSRSKTNEIPKDAVIITEDEALKYQWKIITGWDKLSEVWSLRFAPGIISTLSAATGIYVNNHYRTKLRLGIYGRFSTYLPIVVVPAMFTLLTHKFFVQSEILLKPMAGCPLCLQLRAATFQAGFGVVYPTVLAPLAAFTFATRYYTYRLPSITENPRAVLQLWLKFTRPIAPMLGTIMALQAVVAMYLTGKQEEQNFHLILKMKEMEKQIEAQEQIDTIF